MYITVETEVDVDIDDVLYEITNSPKKLKYFLDLLKEDKNASILLNESKDESKDDFNFVLNKLYNNGWKLTNEEQEIITKIADRF